MRIGQGFDAHRFADEQGSFHIRLGGIDVPNDRRVDAYSDGDVLLHALCDAMLGSLALGDIGKHFPDSDDAYRDIDSLKLLSSVMELVAGQRQRVANLDLTLLAESPRVANYIEGMRQTIADTLEVSLDKISVKATTTEGMGYIGRGEGLAAMAVVLLEPL
ncbi:MAG: 2-C-methyl-D-erythritol 2,4-cyclodiphosphate synthase [Gammaproteobacteria bacterium]|jgi:2-C-methyl-D-erythritol 2,4-cyclodiphosphate synthase|nr:2-C-methyl-D-erythritol 2,4-cyclodiphosphate synthase [Gammaproteobacteria bacterium]